MATTVAVRSGEPYKAACLTKHPLRGGHTPRHERKAAGQRWTVTPVTAGDLLPLPEIDIEIPAAELYEGIEFATSEPGAIPAG